MTKKERAAARGGAPSGRASNKIRAVITAEANWNGVVAVNVEEIARLAAASLRDVRVVVATMRIDGELEDLYPPGQEYDSDGVLHYRLAGR